MKDFESQWRHGLDSGVLRLPQCDHCQQWNWYPLPVCRACGQSQFSWCEVSLSGKLYSWTRVHRNFTGQDMGPMPYTVGLIELDDAPGARVPARFLGENPSALQLDTKVKLEYRQLEGQAVLCFSD